MKLLLDTDQRIFVITPRFQSSTNPIFCNLDQLENICTKYQDRGIESIKHIWNGKIHRISKGDIVDMLKAHDLPTDFYPLA